MTDRGHESHLTRRITGLLSLLCIPLVATAAVSLMMIHHKIHSYALLNYAAAQRMRIERYAHLVDFTLVSSLLEDRPSADPGDLLSETEQEFERIHETIRNGGRGVFGANAETVELPRVDDAQVLAALDQAHKHWTLAKQKARSALQTLADAPDAEADLQAFDRHIADAYLAMDNAVYRLQQRSESQLSRLSVVVTVAVGVALLCLGGTVLYMRNRIIRPFERAGAAVQERERRLRRATIGTNDGLWEWNLATGDAWYSDRFAELLGLRPEELVPHRRSWEDRLHPEDRDRVLQTIQDHELSQSDVDFICRLACSDGQYRWFRLRGAVEPDSRPNPVIAGSIQEITAQVNAERELRASEAFLRGVLDAQSAHIAILDGFGNVSATNKAWREFWSANGGGDEAAGDANYLDVCERCVGVGRDDALAVAAAIRKVSRGESVNASVTYACHSDAEHRWFTVVITPIGASNGVVVAHNDISKLVRMETELCEERSVLREILSTIPYAVFWKDRDSHYLGCNRHFAHLVGLTSPADVVGKTDFELTLRREEAERYRQQDREVLAAGEPLLDTEEMHRCADGTDRVLLSSKVPLRGADGQIRGLVIIFSDITDRKVQDERLRLLSAALEAAANAVVITDCEGTITWANAALCRLTGYELDEVLGANPRIFKSGRHPAKYYEDLWSTVTRGDTWCGEMINRRKDGGLYSEEMTVTPVKDDDGRPTHYIGVKHDITERKRAELVLEERTRLAELGSLVNEALARSTSLRPMLQRCAEHMQEKVDSAFFRIWTLNDEENVLELQASAGMYTHIDGGHARVPVGKFKIGLIAQEATPHLTNDVLGDPRVGDHEWARREGMVSFAGHPLIVEGRVLGVMALFARKELSQYQLGALAAIADSVAIGIQRKRSDAELARLNKELVDASRHAGMSEVATGVLHNIGNVLTGVNTSAGTLAQRIQGSKLGGLSKAADLLAEHVDDLAEFVTRDERGQHLPQYLIKLAEQWASEQRDMLGELESLTESVEHINNIVSVQQSYARQSSIVDEIDLAGLLDQVVQLHAGSLAGRAIEVVRDYEALPMIYTDKHKLLQIFVNLVRNAGHALADAPRRDRRLTLRLCADGGERVCVEVTDNGIGIARENLTRIFAHGFTTKKDGHGFGLHSAALAAKEMGGELTVRSEGPGCGATFVLRVPRKLPPMRDDHGPTVAPLRSSLEETLSGEEHG